MPLGDKAIYTPPYPTYSPKPGTHWPSVFQLGLSLMAFISLFSLASGLLVWGLVQVINPQVFLYDTTPIFLMSAGTALSSFLLLPSAWYSLLRLMGRPAEEPGRLGRTARSLTRPLLLVLVIILVVLLGDFVSRSTRLEWILLPPLHVLAVGLPVLLLAYLGWRGLPSGSLQRSWGVFASGLVLGPLLTLVAELFAILGLVVLGMVYLSLRPELLQELMLLVEQLEKFRDAPEQALPLLSPYLSQPAVIFTVFGFTAGVVPLIEELFKPVGVWLLAGRRLSAAEGFVAGLISGAGFALFENLAFTSTGGEWTASVVLRMGTGLLHILTAGLTGWALALAWSHRRYLRLLLIFFSAVLLHSVWNGLALVTTASILDLPPQIDAERLAALAAVTLVSITFIAFALLLGLNRALRRDQNLLSN
jgi:RsiW-degrading membrane proteinase PrsW (M82 family)